MNLRVIIASVSGAVLNFFLGWLVYGVILMNFYNTYSAHYAGLMKESPNLILIFISGLVTSFLYAYIFDQWANFKTWKKGLIGGLIISFLFSLSMDTYFLAAFNLFARRLVVVDILVGTVMGGIIGALIGWILGFKVKENQAKAAG